MDAETAAAALRARGLHPRVERDSPMAGVAGRTSLGRFVVIVPAREAHRARLVLGTPRPRDEVDRPILRLFLMLGLVSGLVLAAAVVGPVCYGAR
jgi:hypothetical protein